MHEVELLKESNDLVDYYSEIFEKRYRTKPILSNNGSDHTLMKDFVRQLGYAKTKEILDQYIKTNDAWFLTKSHSLSALKSNLNSINTAIATKPLRHAGLIRIQTPFSCDKCFKHFNLICDPAIFDSGEKIYCDNCKTSLHNA